MTQTQTAECRHCGRTVSLIDGYWVDPEATGDDSIWYEVCDENHEDRRAAHEPKPVPTVVLTAYNDAGSEMSTETFTVEVDGQYFRYEEWSAGGNSGADWYDENGDVVPAPWDEDEVDAEAADALFEKRKEAFGKVFYDAYREQVQPILDRIVTEAVAAANAVEPEA